MHMLGLVSQLNQTLNELSNMMPNDDADTAGRQKLPRKPGTFYRPLKFIDNKIRYL
jgi:hypothetical protein